MFALRAQNDKNFYLHQIMADPQGLRVHGKSEKQDLMLSFNSIRFLKGKNPL
jgi:hypothetical protein